MNGVRFYNDSFATAPGACIAAIKAVTGPKVMIVGGYDRGLDLSELARTIKDSGEEIRGVLLIGASAERTAKTFIKTGVGNYTISTKKDMLDIVEEARDMAQPGDAVVLSPSFASFDMFKNFEERGKAFNTAVDSL